MTGDPVVSVVIPTKDRPQSLERAVRSVLAQTFFEWELWIVDDGSDPKVELSTTAATDARVHLLRNDEPTGPGAARNAGAERSLSPFIAFLDDDDEWRPNKLAVQVAALRRDDRVAVVESGYDMYDSDELLFRFEPRPDRDTYEVLLRRPCLQPSTIVVRRAAFEAVGGFPEGPERTEDWIFALDLAERFDVGSNPEPLVRRALTRPSPHEMLRSYAEFVEALEERVQDRPAAERAELLAWHNTVEATYMLEAGDAAGARVKLREAWKNSPTSPRANIYLARSYAGERSWRWAYATAFSIARRLAKLRRGDPVLIRRW